MDPMTTRIPGEDGVGLAVHRWGAAADRPPVLLLHGFAADTESNWARPGIVAALVAAGRQVVGVDARGHGASDKPHDSASYGEPVMARDARRVADELGIGGYDLAGYSMGAIVALLVAAGDKRVRRLVIGGVGAAVAELGGLDTRSVGREALAAALEADDPATVADPAVARFRAFADAMGADRRALAAHARVAHAAPVPLRDITAPTLLVVGTDDPLAVRPQVLVDAIPDADLMLVPGDHLAAVRAPQFTTGLVEFLGRA